MTPVRIGIPALLVGLSVLTGCEFGGVATGPDRSDTIHLDATGIERADVELDMGAGQMIIGGGTSKLVDGRFDYNVDAWKPLVNNSTNGSHAAVTIRQPKGSHGGGRTKYIWDLQLNDHVLTDLSINCGAGQAKLNLGTLLLRGLQVHMGAGQVRVDLSGEPKHDYEVKINGGVGQADIDLPHGVGIWVEAHGGIGSINVTGLQKRGDHWENDLYNSAKVTVKVEVNGGVGEIRIKG